MKKEYCERCCYEYDIKDMKKHDEAVWCQDCNDYHEGWLCQDCYDYKVKK